VKTVEPDQPPAMGRVTATLKLQNWADVEAVAAGTRHEPPRTVEIEALVDTGSTRLRLRESVIAKLGLRLWRTVESTTASGLQMRRLFSPVSLELMARATVQEVIAVPDSIPNLLGQLPLEALDLVVDPKGRKLIGNPEHGGRWTMEMY